MPLFERWDAFFHENALKLERKLKHAGAFFLSFLDWLIHLHVAARRAHSRYVFAGPTKWELRLVRSRRRKKYVRNCPFSLNPKHKKSMHHLFLFIPRNISMSYEFQKKEKYNWKINYGRRQSITKSWSEEDVVCWTWTMRAWNECVAVPHASFVFICKVFRRVWNRTTRWSSPR